MARLASFLTLVLALGLAGCDTLDRLLEVEAPSRVVAADLDDPSRAGLLVESVGNDFRCAFTHYVNVSGMVGWEWRAMSNGSSRVYYDQRTWGPSGWPASTYARSDCGSTGPALYVTLSGSRWFADEVLRRLDEWGTEQVPDKREFEAELSSWAGYSYLLLGESMCTVAFDEGPEQPPEEALVLAVNRFDDAIAAAQETDREEFVNLARVGKGRALLDLGRVGDAAEAVGEVPEGFAFELQYSSLSPETQNRQYRANHDVEIVGVGERYHDMRFEDVPDPRVPVQDEGRDVAGYGVPLWTQQKYTSHDDPVRLAGWEEAQLILAEAAVEDGRLENAVDIINALHQNVGLTEFQSDDPDEIMDQIIYERRAELFLESHHLADLKRYGLPLYPAPGEDFAMGGTYGDRTCFPLPDEEVLNNPNISG